MEIVIVSAGMPSGPNTLKLQSLGGSETAALAMAAALRARGHIVTIFTNLPRPPSPDACEPGTMDRDGVRFMDISQYPPFIQNTEVDLLVVSRDPRLLQVHHQARKTVLWVHDLATYNGVMEPLMSTGWNFDEIWAVSEYHRQQYHKVTGVPLDHIRVTRNGVVKYEIMDFIERDMRQLVYAARPERGLEALVRPGGIMSRLPEFRLKVTMYANFPDHMMPYYQQLNEWAQQLPNVEMLPPHTQQQLRQLIHDSAAYVYPTNFEEVSCILARECLEQKTPMITTTKGALPETLGLDGIFIKEFFEWNSDEFCQMFADLIKQTVEAQPAISDRTDLYWDGVAEQWEGWAEPKAVKPFSRLWSLVEDSDVVAAIAYAQTIPLEERTNGVRRFILEMERLYPYLYGRESFADYYERYFRDDQDPRQARKKPDMLGNPRFEAIATEVSKLAPGSRVLDYGCAEGVIILGLAKRFPALNFTGVDFAPSNIALCEKYAAEDGLQNVRFFAGSSDDWPAQLAGDYHSEAPFDAAVCSEVLEHVAKPWVLADFVEANVKIGGRVITTVPAGPWEAIGLYDKNQYNWRAHIWHINKWMLRKMFADKQNPLMMSLTNGHGPDGRHLGHLVWCYDADHKGVWPIDPVEKAMNHRSRQSVGAAIIAQDNEETILKMLNSLGKCVQQVHIALGPGTDGTIDIIEAWETSHPWVQVTVKDVPKIVPKLFGFDDARNMSIEGIDTDWVLWVDTDEFLVGDFRKFARNNLFDSYAIHQHHFTVEPRGTPTQLDKPARLFRNGRFKFYGKVHEHAEIGYNEGPGFCFVLPNVDLGHPGYENEEVRQKRFVRNFPLLEWDRDVYPDRKLGIFLWLRDMVHRMRFCMMSQDANGARLLAEEAISFYKANCCGDSISALGDVNALTYVTEAMGMLGRGLPVSILIEVNGQQRGLAGVFDDEEEVARLVKLTVKGDMERRRSGYWS